MEVRGGESKKASRRRRILRSVLNSPVNGTRVEEGRPSRDNEEQKLEVDEDKIHS